MPPPTVFSGDTPWKIELTDSVRETILGFSKEFRIETGAKLKLLEQAGPNLPRPHADKLRNPPKGLEDVRELRVELDRNPWRAIYIFRGDTALVVAMGSKAGYPNDGAFYTKILGEALKNLRTWDGK